jgi:cell division control protein 6
MHNVLTLDCYTAHQLEDILDYRIREAFKENTIAEEIVSLIADIAARWGDARFALELLWRAGVIADNKGSNFVTPEYVRIAKAEIYPEIKKEVLHDLQLHEKLLLLAIAQKLKHSNRAYLLTGEAEQSYRLVCEEYGEYPRKHTQLWEYLERMEGIGLIDLRPSGKEHRGRSTRISIPDIPVTILGSELKRSLKAKAKR